MNAGLLKERTVRNFLLGIVFTVVALVVFLKIGTPLMAQQDRLQVHASMTLDNAHLKAVCDTGNGVIVYIVRGTAYGNFGGIAAVPNGCKIQK